MWPWIIGIKVLVLSSLRTSWLAVYRRKLKSLRSWFCGGKSLLQYLHQKGSQQRAPWAVLEALGRPGPGHPDDNPSYNLELLEGFCSKGKASGNEWVPEKHLGLVAALGTALQTCPPAVRWPQEQVNCPSPQHNSRQVSFLLSLHIRSLC